MDIGILQNTYWLDFLISWECSKSTLLNKHYLCMVAIPNVIYWNSQNQSRMWKSTQGCWYTSEAHSYLFVITQAQFKKGMMQAPNVCPVKETIFHMLFYKNTTCQTD